MKANGTGFSRVLRAASCSFAGLTAAWRCEAAFRQEVVLGAILAVVAGFLAGDTATWLHLISPLILVLIVELINSAIEAVSDKVTGEWDALIKRAKDIGSAAVFLSLINLVVVWLSVLWVKV